jgi:hypothetical protein
VVDSTEPTFTVPPAITIYADDQCSYDASVAKTGDVTDENDNCSSAQATFSDAIAAIPNTTDRLITRTWTLDDGSGNMLTQTQLITVEDTTPVEFMLLGANPFDIAQNATDPISGFVARDNCLGDLTANVTVDSSQLDRSIAATYTITYTLNYTDAAGSPQTETLTRTVNVTGNSSTVVLSAAVCSGQFFNLAGLIVDYSLTASRFDFYTADPATGGTLFRSVPAFRGRARFPVMVQPTSNVDYWVRTVYTSGATADAIIQLTVQQCGGTVSPIVMLEGAYDSGTGRMRTSLQQQGLLPTIEPYTALGYQFVQGGGEQMQASANFQQLVDWVVIELRDSADPTSIVYSRAALLRADGRVVDTDGFSVVDMPWAIPGKYHVVIRHRNHLAVMTQFVFHIEPGRNPWFDLSNPQTPTVGSNAQHSQNRRTMLFAGDADGNGQVQNTDNILQWQPQVGSSGYKSSDFNLDGQVQNTDLIMLWRRNTGRGSAVPD